jgi:hypothetical protein
MQALLLGVAAWPAAAQVTIAPGTAVDFGVAPPGQILEKKFTVTNVGSTRFYADVRLTGAQFWLHRATCRLTLDLGPGESCDMLVRFAAPAVCSNYQAQLQVFEWSGQHAPTGVGLTASGGLGAPPCVEAQGTTGSRWTRVFGPDGDAGDYPGTWLTVADLGDDGEMDAILVTTPTSVAEADWHTERLTKVRVFTYTAGAQFIDTTARWFGTSPLMMPVPFRAVVADLNGDGKDDIAMACNNEDGRPTNDPANGNFLWYTPQYAFMSSASDAYSIQQLGDNVEYGTGLAAGDIDKDGDVDLVLSGNEPVPGVPNKYGMYFLVNDGLGHFSAGPVVPFDTATPSLGFFAWPALADLDGDGDADLLFGRARDPHVSVVRNDNGTFVWQRDIEVFPGTYDPSQDVLHVDLGVGTTGLEGVTDLQTADFDGDGIVDFVAFAGGRLDNNPYPVATMAMQRVVRGLGGLDFQPLGNVSDLAQTGGALYQQVLSLNGDNAPDVFARQQGAWASQLQFKQLRNLGDGRFRFENMLAFPANDPLPDATHLADMNRDGRPDVLATYHNGPDPASRAVLINAMPEQMSRPLQSLSIGDVSLGEGNSGTKQAQFAVTLSSPALVPVSFDAYTAPGTATAGVDYQSNAVVGQVIPAGATSGNFAVTINGDVAFEASENFSANLANAPDASIADGLGVGTILNDDQRALSINDASVTEGASGTRTMTFTVSLSHASGATVYFHAATANGTATGGSDFVARAATLLSIPAGQLSRTFAVTINGDTAIEPSETLAVNLSAATGATILDGQGVGTIVNDDGPALSIGDVAILEGNAGTKVLRFTVSLSPASAGAVTYNIATANGTATAGSDYVARSLANQSIPAGTLSKVFDVTVNGDAAIEPTETVLVNVSNVVGGYASDGQAIGTITNDDGPTLSIADVATLEGASGVKVLRFTVSLSQAAAGPVTYSIATANGTATAGSDYVARSLANQSIPAGTLSKVFDVTVNGDTAIEANEAFVVNLSASTGASIMDGQATGTITNDDGPTLSIADVATLEGASGTKVLRFTVSLSQAAAGTVTYNIATANGTALAGSDYVARSLQNQSVAAGVLTKVFDVTINGDATVEPSETFAVNLGGSTGASILDGQATGTISNDD